MSDFSFSYEKHKRTYIINASLKNHGMGIRILADENGWLITSTFSSDHPLKNEIRRCLIQYVLQEVSQNQPLKEDLLHLTYVNESYRVVLEHSSDEPLIRFDDLKPRLFTEHFCEIALTCKVHHGLVAEDVTVIYRVSKEGYEQIELLREDVLKQLENEGFPLHPLSDEQILTSINNHDHLQQDISGYVMFSQYILALKAPSFTYSFTIAEYEKKNRYHEFKLRLKDSPLILIAFFEENQLEDLVFELDTPDTPRLILSYDSDPSTFMDLYDELYEFVTKKSKYRIKFIF